MLCNLLSTNLQAFLLYKIYCGCLITEIYYWKGVAFAFIINCVFTRSYCIALLFQFITYRPSRRFIETSILILLNFRHYSQQLYCVVNPIYQIQTFKGFYWDDYIHIAQFPRSIIRKLLSLTSCDTSTLLSGYILRIWFSILHHCLVFEACTIPVIVYLFRVHQFIKFQ